MKIYISEKDMPKNKDFKCKGCEFIEHISATQKVCKPTGTHGHGKMLKLTVRRLPHEIWAKYNEDYYISNRGRWYSVGAKRLLAQYPNSAGYFRTTVVLNGKAKHLFTHIKVVELFGDCNGCKMPDTETLRELGLSIDHLDRNKSNNRQDNLELVSHSENCKRKFIAIGGNKHGNNN